MLLRPIRHSNQPTEFGTGPSVNTDYVKATGNSLIANGLGELTNNYNFPDFVFDPLVTPNVKGSFRRDGYYAGALLFSELISVDPSSIYMMEGSILQESHPLMLGSGHLQYLGISCVDIDGFEITARNTMTSTFGGTTSRTTIAAPLSPGDMSMTLTDVSGWDNGPGTATFRRGAIIWGYKNSLGYKYDYYSRFNTADLWDPGAINSGTGVVTLKTAFPAFMGNPDDVNGTWPIGTEISNPSSSGTYKYVAMSPEKTLVPDKWYKGTGFIGGVDRSGTNYNLNFSPGTAFVRPLILANYTNRAGGFSTYPDTGANHSVHFAKLSMTRLYDNTTAVRGLNGAVTFKVQKQNNTTNVVNLGAPTRTFAEEV